MSKYELEDDIVLAKFINYMQLALYHRRLNYYRNLQRIQEFETSINESSQYVDEENIIKTPDINILKNKEIYLLNLHYSRGLSYEQISAITGEIEIRDNAILHLFLNSGLRLAELKNLSIDDLDLKDNKFSIIGKGNKERTGYINDITRKALDEYLKVRDKLNPKTKTLFVSRYGLKMSSTGIEKIVKRAYEKAEIDDEDYCVHTLRHTCATLLYRNGVDIRTIQEILGHVQIDTTEIYTHLHDQEVMDAMLDHPLSQFKMANAEAFCA